MGFQPLTEREIQIIGLVSNGFTDKESGIELGISHLTIKKSLQKSMFKTRCKNRPHLVASLIRMGLLT